MDGRLLKKWSLPSKSTQSSEEECKCLSTIEGSTGLGWGWTCCSRSTPQGTSSWWSQDADPGSLTPGPLHFLLTSYGRGPWARTWHDDQSDSLPRIQREKIPNRVGHFLWPRQAHWSQSHLCLFQNLEDYHKMDSSSKDLGHFIYFLEDFWAHLTSHSHSAVQNVFHQNLPVRVEMSNSISWRRNKNGAFFP